MHVLSWYGVWLEPLLFCDSRDQGLRIAATTSPFLSPAVEFSEEKDGGEGWIVLGFTPWTLEPCKNCGSGQTLPWPADELRAHFPCGAPLATYIDQAASSLLMHSTTKMCVCWRKGWGIGKRDALPCSVPGSATVLVARAFISLQPHISHCSSPGRVCD